MKEKIWEIHTFGTSFTKGGGFEFWKNPELRELYKDYPTPQFQFNYSWPGQLQEMIQNDSYKTKVFNHAKSGYGHELAIREAHRILSNNFEEQSRYKLDHEYKIFIFEFGALGRKEHHINNLGYVISNYHFKTKDTEFTHVVRKNDEEVETITHGNAQTYFEDDVDTLNKIKEIEPVISNFNGETLNFEAEQRRMSIEILNFIGFLEKQNINYFIVSEPFLTYELSYLREIYRDKSVILKREGDAENHMDMYGFLAANKLRIRDETNGIINDGHGGHEGNMEIANIIYKRILKEYQLPTHNSKELY